MAQRFASILRIHTIPFLIKCRRVCTRKRETGWRKLTRHKTLDVNNDIITPSRLKRFEDVRRVGETRARSGNQYPRLVPPHDPFAKRSSANVVVYKSMSNYGLTRLANGRNDFNPFAMRTYTEYL